jgi:hypothetical protein
MQTMQFQLRRRNNLLYPIALISTWLICKLMRVNSTNVLDEGLRIGEIGHQMKSKVNQSNKVAIESKRGCKLGLLSICPLPSPPGPYI